MSAPALAQAGASASPHATAPRGMQPAPHVGPFEGRFGRMFRHLPAGRYGRTDADSEANLRKLAGSMVATPDPAKDGADAEESGIPALYTYLGQFIDHDLTFDPTSSLQRQNDPAALVDFRSPAFDLDCVYGRGPDDQPYMYDGSRFLTGGPLTGSGNPGAVDLARAANGRAIIGDPRNDENVIVSQFHGLFLAFHNRLVRNNPAERFEDLQRQVRFHYQYVILNDFLPRIIHSSVLKGLQSNGHYDASKLRFFHIRQFPFMPLEFSGACYRFGHSMVRPGYRLNDATLLDIFPGLTGFKPMVPVWAIDWGRFVDTDIRTSIETNPADKQRRLQLAYRIDTSIVNPLGNLPASVASNPPSLPERNLLRGFRLGLPTGQSVARAMGLTPIADKDIVIGKSVDKPEEGDILGPITDPEVGGSAFAGNCPLWTYILAEAARNKEKVTIPVKEPNVKINTPRLGPVGGRIVAEVFLGLMFADPSSLLRLDPMWHPASGTGFSLKDFVNFALGH